MDEELNPELGRAVQQSVVEDGAMTRWLAVAEIMDEDGYKRLIAMRGPTAEMLPTWDYRGWLWELLNMAELFDDD